jgi:hypothetical protein
MRRSEQLSKVGMLASAPMSSHPIEDSKVRSKCGGPVALVNMTFPKRAAVARTHREIIRSLVYLSQQSQVVLGNGQLLTRRKLPSPAGIRMPHSSSFWEQESAAVLSVNVATLYMVKDA